MFITILLLMTRKSPILTTVSTNGRKVILTAEFITTPISTILLMVGLKGQATAIMVAVVLVAVVVTLSTNKVIIPAIVAIGTNANRTVLLCTVVVANMTVVIPAVTITIIITMP